jgi:Fe-S-cluster containining protein
LPLNCGDCHKCEEYLWGSFYPGEEWKLKYFEGYAFQVDGVWFLDTCPYYDGEKCGVHEELWRPIQCQSYPCYINYQGKVEVDFELCPKAQQVDETFKAKIQGLYDQLNLSLEQLERWGKVVVKYSEAAKRPKK